LTVFFDIEFSVGLKEFHRFLIIQLSALIGSPDRVLNFIQDSNAKYASGVMKVVYSSGSLAYTMTLAATRRIQAVGDVLELDIFAGMVVYL
jgi:hypothetical protein